MSFWFVVLALAFFVFLFSQFGAALAARNAVAWWLVVAFLTVGMLRPELYLRVSELLGFQLVSNFVFAAMFVFLIIQLVQIGQQSTLQSRRMRAFVSRVAADDFVARNRQVSYAGSALVVVPCFNEQDALPDMLPRLDGLRMPFCVVDDGSLDGSRRILEGAAPERAAFHGTNIGVAGVLLTGFAIALRTGAEFVVQCDGDGQHPVELIPTLCDEARARGADILIGSRFARGGNGIGSTSIARRAGGLWLSAVIGLLAGVRVTDPTSGFRVFSRKAMETLVRAMPDEYPEPEAIMLAAVSGLRVVEIPVAMSARRTGGSSIAGLQGLQYVLKATTAILGIRLRRLLALLKRA